MRLQVGYLSVSEARAAQVPFAAVRNRHGNVTQAAASSVQLAMDARVNSFSDRFTQDLVDADAEGAYPIAGFTYFILRMAVFEDCRKATQLFRYIDWFAKSEEAHKQCTELDMVPLRYFFSSLIPIYPNKQHPKISNS